MLMSNPEIGGPAISGISHEVGAGFRALSTALRAAPAVAADAKAVKAAQLATNVAKGAKAEEAAVAKMGDKVAGRQVTLESSTTGKRSVTDIVSKDKEVTEVKSGNSPLSQGQKDVKADIDAGRDVIPRGENAEKAGLTPGQPTQMKCYTVDRCP